MIGDTLVTGRPSSTPRGSCEPSVHSYAEYFAGPAGGSWNSMPLRSCGSEMGMRSAADSSPNRDAVTDGAATYFGGAMIATGFLLRSE
ncbi:hypothetical protein BJF84_21220 [Rhodococcus sp. CUA-806]|nr:hypothetical protein BJF84_21220 [Rhodococcus sp. CUA-806]